MNTLRLIIGFIIILVVAVVVVANLQGDRATTVHLLAAEKQTSVGVVILLAWAFGVLSFGIYALVGEIQLRTRLARSQREKEQMMRELTELRNLPLVGEEPAAEGAKPGAKT
jgi:uncharacterized integral membrane protein